MPTFKHAGELTIVMGVDASRKGWQMDVEPKEAYFEGYLVNKGAKFFSPIVSESQNRRMTTRRCADRRDEKN